MKTKKQLEYQFHTIPFNWVKIRIKCNLVRIQNTKHFIPVRLKWNSVDSKLILKYWTNCFRFFQITVRSLALSFCSKMHIISRVHIMQIFNQYVIAWLKFSRFRMLSIWKSYSKFILPTNKQTKKITKNSWHSTRQFDSHTWLIRSKFFG